MRIPKGNERHICCYFWASSGKKDNLGVKHMKQRQAVKMFLSETTSTVHNKTAQQDGWSAMFVNVGTLSLDQHAVN